MKKFIKNAARAKLYKALGINMEYHESVSDKYMSCETGMNGAEHEH